MQKRALITGVTGFTGRYLAKELTCNGYEVYGLGNGEIEAVTQVYDVDLLDEEGLQRTIAEVNPDVVVHLAALSFVGHADVNAFYTVNLIGTRNLLAALASEARDVKRVLLVSSANVYGNQAGELDERTRFSPTNDYAASKASMELMSQAWKDRLPLVVVRPFNYTGVGQANRFLVPKIVSHFVRGESVIELGNIDVWRDFSDVRSVVKAYRLLLEKDLKDNVFNVASGVLHSLREIIEHCEDITGHDIEVKVNPNFVRQNEVLSLCGNSQRLSNNIASWNEYTLRDSLEWMLGFKG